MNVVARCLHPLAKEEGLPASKSKDHAGNQEAQMELLGRASLFPASQCARVARACWDAGLLEPVGVDGGAANLPQARRELGDVGHATVVPV